MAAPMPVPEVQAYTAPNSSEEEQQASLDTLVSRMRAGTPSPRDLIAGMAAQLTSEDDRVRTRGCMLFAQVLAAAPELFAADSDVQTAADFLSARLADRVSARAALTGCLALLQRKGARVAGVPAANSPTAVVMMQRFLQHIMVQAFGQPERMLAFELLETAIEAYGHDLLASGMDVAGSVAAAAEGERDPRCLLRIFACVRAAAALYSQGSSTTAHIVAVEALFDSLTWYFPMSFTPPPINKFNITRETLVEALEGTIAADPAFAPHFVPLALDKLSSDVRLAKLDSLSALAVCAEAWGPAGLNRHVTSLWRGLRPELFASSTYDAIADSNSDEVADAAASCLQRFVTALGSPMYSEVLTDTCVDDMATSLQSATAESLPRSSALVQATSRLLAAVAGGSSQALDAVASRLAPFLLPAAKAHSGDSEAAAQAQFSPLDPTVPADRRFLQTAALAAAHDVIRAALHSPPAPDDTGPGGPFREFASGLLDICLDAPSGNSSAAPALAALEGDTAMAEASTDEDEGQRLQSAGSDAEAGHSDAQDSDAHKQLQHAKAAVVASLASFPAARSPLSRPQLQRVVAALLRRVPGESASPDSPVVHGLRSLAGAGQHDLLREDALPHLLAAFRSAPCPDGSSLPAAVLAALSGASPVLRPLIVTALSEDLRRALSERQQGGESTHKLLAALGCVRASLEGAPRPYSDVDQAAVSTLLRDILAFPGYHLLPEPAREASVSCAAALARGCQLSAAQTLWLTACGIVASGASDSLATIHDPATQQQQAAVSAAVLAVLPAPAVRLHCSAVDSEGSGMTVPGALLALALLRGGDPAAAAVLATATASLFNKAPAGPELGAAVQQAVDRQLSPALEAQGAEEAVGALAGLARALCMRGHAAAAGCIQRLVQLTSTAEPEIAQVAVQGVGLLLSEPRDEVVAAVADHSVTKPLWQQRAFTHASAAVLAELGARLRAQQPAPLPLGAALVALTASAPARVLRGDAPRLLPWLLQTLQQLHRAAPNDEFAARALPSAVEAVRDVVLQPTAKEATEEQADRLLALLLELVGFTPTAAVRRVAVECLAALALLLPPATVESHREAVTAAARRALDDKKRDVRSVALRCRTSWTGGAW